MHEGSRASTYDSVRPPPPKPHALLALCLPAHCIHTCVSALILQLNQTAQHHAFLLCSHGLSSSQRMQMWHQSKQV
jgi:hypothetical protein